MLRLGAVPVDPPLILAPMAGITDHAYRLMLRRIGGVGLVTMEFISSEAITRGIARQLRKMVFTEEERPLSIQIYGSDPQRMAAATDIVEELAPDVCDINMGCPANKVLKGCAGAALMADPKLARSIVSEVRSRLSMPLTVKFRLGVDDARKNFLEIGRICEGEGAAAVAMHGRTARQMYTGRADYRRAGRPAREAGLEERRDLMLAHFSAIEREAFDPREALHKLRTMTGWYTHGLTNGRALRVRISDLATPADFRAAVEEFFEGQTATAAEPVAASA